MNFILRLFKPSAVAEFNYLFGKMNGAGQSLTDIDAVWLARELSQARRNIIAMNNIMMGKQEKLNKIYSFPKKS
jgi:hypothetical protein